MMRSLFCIFTLFLGLSACSPQENFSPVTPFAYDEDGNPDLVQYADVLRSTYPDFQNYFSDPLLTAVTDTFGPSVISTNSLPLKSSLARAKKTPWSSWWFPKKDNFLFAGRDGQLGALQKYDLYRKQSLPSAASAASFDQQGYNPQTLPWEGLCDAWALASILSPEPRQAVRTQVGHRRNPQELIFNVSDLKGLLLKTFEALDEKQIQYFGQRFTGNQNGWIYPDLFPEQFHRFIEIQLFQKGEAFVMDHDPGVEVWNVPVFKANYSIASVPDEKDSVFVRMWLFSAEPVRTDEKSFVGTKEAVREYNYILKGARNPTGDLVIESGYWVKGPDGSDSRKNHPDYFLFPKTENIQRRSWNPEIDVEIVDQLVSPSF
jgi:hypothetical protein